MNIQNLTNSLSSLTIKSSITKNIDITSITYNSKEVTADGLFACKGAKFKPQYLDQAISLGACIYISEHVYSTDINYIIVSDIREAMAIIACNFYENAFDNFNLIGLTGTKGKSTTSYYIKYILDNYAQQHTLKPTGIISTIDYYDGSELKSAVLTTPEAFELQRHFHNAHTNGLDNFVMEVSSQALKYQRVLGTTYDYGIFLNISLDHISDNEHSDFEDYFSSKLELFKQTKTALVCANTDYYDRVMQSAQQSQNIVTFGVNIDCDYNATNLKKHDDRITFDVVIDGISQPFCITMAGLFNVENAVSAIAVCHKMGIDIPTIRAGLEVARSSGRMELYKQDDTIAIVDYAHNRLSFEKLFSSAKEEYPNHKLICVFGCPGGKAHNRRQELSEIASQYCDLIVITTEDPGYESVEEICQEMSQYIKCDYQTVIDRGEAVQFAVDSSVGETLILITGKGNEGMIKMAGGCVPCPTDSEYVLDAFKNMNTVVNV